MLRCPYCGHEDEAGEMIADDTSRYLRAVLMREVVQPTMDRFFSGMADEQNARSRQGSFISIKASFTRSLRPPLPIHGPEPPDMIAAKMLCCGKRLKMMDGWRGAAVCPYCKTNIVIE